MRSAHGRIGRRSCYTCTALAALAAALLAGSASAQQRSLISPSDAYFHRQLRSLEGRAGSARGGAELQLQRTRRDLVSRNRGVDFGPEAARIDRGLDRVGRDLQRERLDRADRVTAPVSRAAPLPSSYQEGDPLPSFDPARTVGSLLGRAERALREGRSAQAGSDLATARSLMDGVDATSPAGAALALRLTDVEARLGASGS